MTTLVLVRHGHTDTAGKRLTGLTRGVRLNERGRAEADRLVERLDGVRVDAIVSSPLERCRETAAPLAKARGLAVRIRRAWIEVDYGDWTGRPIAGLRRTRLWRTVMAAPSNARFPNGESFSEMQHRIVSTLDRLRAAHPGGTIVCVSHADPIKAAVAHALGTHLDLFQRIVISTCAISVLVFTAGGPAVLAVNSTGGSLKELRAS